MPGRVVSNLPCFFNPFENPILAVFNIVVAIEEGIPGQAQEEEEGEKAPTIATTESV